MRLCVCKGLLCVYQHFPLQSGALQRSCVFCQTGSSQSTGLCIFRETGCLFNPPQLDVSSLRSSAPLAAQGMCLPAQEGKRVGLKLLQTSRFRGQETLTEPGLQPLWPPNGEITSFPLSVEYSSELHLNRALSRVQMSFRSRSLAGLRTSTLAFGPILSPLPTSS